MKIHDQYYLSGMPANEEYQIEVKPGLVLTLSINEFQSLCDSIGEKQSSDQARIEKAIVRYDSRVKKTEAFIKDLQNIFYHGDEDGDFMFRTELKDIDEDKLFEALENHKEILGLE